MRGVSFQDRAGRVVRSPYRTDVALFVGHVDRRRMRHRPGGAPADLRPVQPVLPRRGEDVREPRDRDRGLPDLHRWLAAEGWARGDVERDRAAGLDELLDVPVPIDRFDTFDRLFAWDQRPVGDADAPAALCDTYLGAAVRAFFAQGGRLCYVVRVGAPWPVALTPAQSQAAIAARAERLARLIPGATGGLGASPLDRASWRGVWALFGLPDVSLVAVPELPDVVAAPLAADAPLPAWPVAPVGFLECSEPVAATDTDWLRRLAAPRCDDDGFAAWADAVHLLVDEVARPRSSGGLREVQVVAAVPLPAEAVTDLRRHLDLLPRPGGGPGGLSRDLDAGGLSSAFLQLGYPWLVGETTGRLPGGLAPPDATLVGAIARGALTHGCFRSIAGQPLRGITATSPALPSRDLADPADPTTLAARVTALARTPAGIEARSDVTTSTEPTFRQAHASRTVAAVVRVLRTLGEEHAFASNGEATWAALRLRVRDVLRGFWQAGALRGASESEAFAVRCDRSTMTDDDLEAGRLVVVVELAVAVAIERITVVLTRTGDGVSLERAA